MTMSLSDMKPQLLKPVKLVVPKEIPKKDDPNEYSEKEKMLLGIPYKSFVEELLSGRAFSKSMCQKLNNMDTLDIEGRSRVIKDLLGASENPVIESPFIADYGSNIYLGKNVFIDRNCLILDNCEVIIGDNTKFGPGVQILTATHPLDPIERRYTEYPRPIKIGNNCVIGANAVVLPAVTIGDNVTIEPGSIVNRNIESNCIAGGNPARIIKKLQC